MIQKRVRCAIYTRKSHEEGLDLEFNSLDAQRESAEAYIERLLAALGRFLVAKAACAAIVVLRLAVLASSNLPFHATILGELPFQHGIAMGLPQFHTSVYVTRTPKYM